MSIHCFAGLLNLLSHLLNFIYVVMVFHHSVPEPALKNMCFQPENLMLSYFSIPMAFKSNLEPTLIQIIWLLELLIPLLFSNLPKMCFHEKKIMTLI